MLLACLAVLSQALPPAPPATRPEGDWLIRSDTVAGVYRGEHPDEIVLDNGLIRRTIRLRPNAATVAFDNLMTGQSMLRGVKPEASIELDGIALDVGGLVGQPDYAYLRREWLERMTSGADALVFTGFETGTTTAPFEWRRSRWLPKQLPWPPPGRSLTLRFILPLDAAFRIAEQRDGTEGLDRTLEDEVRVRTVASALASIEVRVHYEIYDGLPVLGKWLTIANLGAAAVRLDRFTSEILAVVESESIVDSTTGLRLPDLDVLTDYSFGGMSIQDSNHASGWVADPQYQTQVNYRRTAPMMLVARPEVGPAVEIEPGATFESFRIWEVVHDSTDRERKGLTLRRAYRTLAPWCTENPIMMHVRRADPDSVRLAIDQCAAVGFEMVILTFGSGFDIENEDPAYLAQMKALADYAHENGVQLGGYSLLSSRRIGPETDVIDEATGKPGGAKFGNAPCLCSEWGREYFAKLMRFYEATGFDLLEHDGSYPGDFCASADHPGHAGNADSQWQQWSTIRDFYRWCRSRGIYLNVPDSYFFAGSTKIAMGYRETNWSLPRAQQIIHARQNIYDGTWTKTPSMGWMFVPLTQYHGGGAAATIEPLDEHLADYEAHLANNFGLGVQACYRGPRLFDTERTRAAVENWVDFFETNRAILESDLIHLRRADGRDLDFMLHVNPELDEKGMLVVFNPLDRDVEKVLQVPLYYTGLDRVAMVAERDGEPRRLELDREFTVALPVRVPARRMTWFVFRGP